MIALVHFINILLTLVYNFYINSTLPGMKMDFDFPILPKKHEIRDIFIKQKFLPLR